MSLAALAKLLGVRRHLAEDALHSERAARAVLSRRELFVASGALAAGSVFSFSAPKPFVLHPFMAALCDAVADATANGWLQMAWMTQLPVHVLLGGETEAVARGRIRADVRREVIKVLSR
jgi:hypothetical protein